MAKGFLNRFWPQQNSHALFLDISRPTCFSPYCPRAFQGTFGSLTQGMTQAAPNVTLIKGHALAAAPTPSPVRLLVFRGRLNAGIKKASKALLP